MTTTLILGGAKSGKSYVAEKLALSATEKGARPTYIATAQAFDEEMSGKIKQHRDRRGNKWHTVEAALKLPEAISSTSSPKRAILVDCLTLWLSNLIHVGLDAAQEFDKLIEAIENARGPLILVSNEVGQGIVPNNQLARRFRDLAGELNQVCAISCDKVIFVVAGLPQILKEPL